MSEDDGDGHICLETYMCAQESYLPWISGSRSATNWSVNTALQSRPIRACLTKPKVSWSVFQYSSLPLGTSRYSISCAHGFWNDNAMYPATYGLNVQCNCIANTVMTICLRLYNSFRPCMQSRQRFNFSAGSSPVPSLGRSHSRICAARI